MIRMQINFAIYLVTAALFVVTTAYAAESAQDIKQRMGKGNPVKGKSRSELCQGCHGELGVSMENMIPNLSGQYADYIAKQLRNFQTGARTHQIMSAMAQTINDTELTDIAAYFASQKKMQGNGKGDNPVAKNLFAKGDVKRGIPPCMSGGQEGPGKAHEGRRCIGVTVSHAWTRKEVVAKQVVDLKN